MAQIYNGKHLAHYAQVIIFDPNMEGSIPEWGTENENESFASGASGLCIATANNAEIEVSIYDNEADISSEFTKVGEQDIAVGSSGFRVGDVTTNSLADVAYKSGNCRIQIYTNSLDNAQVTSVSLIVG